MDRLLTDLYLESLAAPPEQIVLDLDATDIPLYGHQPARVFAEFSYRTHKSWSCARRVVAKAEYLDKGENPRFVVTSLTAEQWPAQDLYEKNYCARGEMENRINI